MSTSRKIQIALGAILLWSSTSVSSFAATNTITPGKNQSVTVKIPVESIPSRQLNLTPDTKLIAFDFGSLLRMMPNSSVYIAEFEAAWKQSDRKQRILTFCNTKAPGGDVETCYQYLRMWLIDKDNKYIDAGFNPPDPGIDGNDFSDLLRAKPPGK
ncbi:hypothetical protein [Anabaena lutea]|uniref:Uncharacterized protein n=1 Tax=Anabaena lutea FACHB-196 TaxID=2692881 RepID=A0ABR8FKZ5_9NOST|nr:hypothetical protein [Anabaena lutea]MBD2569842.1 hypothetical protein [Anabaena lutea FACHB-196]